MNYRLVLDGITKTFGTLRANDNITIQVKKGTVHAILGENGAGKSTLMNILYGLYQPDQGRILRDGQQVKIDSPATALDYGIGMVHQRFMLVGPMTVAENIILGMKDSGFGLSRKKHRRNILELSDTFSFDTDPDKPVSKLPVGMQQRVEILKLLYRNADILILDEPTSVLTSNEIKPFFHVLSKLKASGKTILFITHKLDEVMEVSDNVTILRNGQVIADVVTNDSNPGELARLMVGRDVVFDIRNVDMHIGGDVMLEAKGIHAINDRGLTAIDNLSFKIRTGEILGIGGVDGNGQSELAELIAGLRPLTSGKILMDGEDITYTSVTERKHRLRIGYVPEDRHRFGLVLDHSLSFNLMLRSYTKVPFTKHGLLNLKEIRRHAAELVKRYDIRVRDVDQLARELSGGNQQKLIIARELEEDLNVLIVAQPTKGLDVGAIEFVQKQIIDQCARGTAILYISTELEHLMAVSDKIAVIFRGRLSQELPVAEVNSEKIGLLMTGANE